jgi:hypothetical protein
MLSLLSELSSLSFHAALDEEGGDDEGDQRSDKLQDLPDFSTTDFHLL